MALVVPLAGAVRDAPQWWTAIEPAPAADEPVLPGSPPVWRAALEADARGSVCPIADVWHEVVQGRLAPWWASVGADRILLVARLASSRRGLHLEGASVITRVFCGDPQKVVASELGIATSTISGRYVRALAKLEISPRNVPLALILAAQSASGVGPVAAARSCEFDHRQRACRVVSLPRATPSHLTELTHAEQEVAGWIIEGFSRFEVARQRMTSVHTVARQFHSIFETMRATGRYSLIRRAVERGAFQ